MQQKFHSPRTGTCTLQSIAVVDNQMVAIDIIIITVADDSACFHCITP